MTMRSSCVQALNEGGNTSPADSEKSSQNIVIGNLSSSNEAKKPVNIFFGLRTLESTKPNSIKANLGDKKQSLVPEVDHEIRLKPEEYTSDSLGVYSSKFSGIKGSVGINFSGEKLIEEIEVDSVLDLNLSEQDICTPYEGK